MTTSPNAPGPAAAVPAPAPDPERLAAELGLSAQEHRRIHDTLRRVPSVAELGTYSVLWSEHCSYKSSKVHLRGLPTTGEHLLAGVGENAGVVDVGGGMAVAFKIESHNHPSFVEPFQGAATGVGGIIRDILTMGARPLAILDPLRFGDPGCDTTRRIVDGVVRGIGHYGNCIGVPTVGGEVAFDPCYDGNPLVNALCVGVLPVERLQLARAERPGDVAVLIGQRTGRDGIGGASVLASAEFGGDDDVDVDTKRPNVQVGDPFAGKLLIESCLELYERDLLSGIQDMGAAGIACSTAEMASKAGLGMRVDLDAVPLREAAMEAWEILCSESQERMLALVAPDRLDEVLRVCARWGVEATPIGAVTEGDRLVVTHRGEVVHDAPARSLADEGPVYERPVADWVHPARADDVDALASPEVSEGAAAGTAAGGTTPRGGGPDLTAAAWRVLASPNVADPRWISEQYDCLVGHATVQGPGSSAAVLRLPDPSGAVPAHARGVAIATDGNGRWCALDPFEGAKLVVAEAARNVACTGARPVAATNCLNFGSPERPEIMGQFRAVVAGLGAACEALGTPITGGNVSFYNQTGDTAIHPTPIVGVLGVLDDVARAVPNVWREPGERLFLVGADTRPGLGGSEYLFAVHGRVAGTPPGVDLAAERALHELLATAAEVGWLRSAHDVATGGLLVTVAETAVRAGLGARLRHPSAVPPLQWLFSESPTRAVVSTSPHEAVPFAERCARQGVPCAELGTVVDEPAVDFGGLLELALTEVADAWGGGFAAAIGEPA